MPVSITDTGRPVSHPVQVSYSPGSIADLHQSGRLQSSTGWQTTTAPYAGVGFTDHPVTFRLELSNTANTPLLTGILTNTERQKVFQATVELAQSLNLHTVVEGVEDEPTAQWLARFTGLRGQGYFWGRPVLLDSDDTAP